MPRILLQQFVAPVRQSLNVLRELTVAPVSSRLRGRVGTGAPGSALSGIIAAAELNSNSSLADYWVNPGGMRLQADHTPMQPHSVGFVPLNVGIAVLSCQTAPLASVTIGLFEIDRDYPRVAET